MKHFSNLHRLTAAVIAVAILFSGCASTTMIDSYPSGANLYLDGEPVGSTPYPMTDSKIIGSCTSVKIVKENHEPFYTSICRDEEPDFQAIVGGFFFWPFFFWAMKYKPSHIYQLFPKGSTMSSRDYDNDEESLDSLWKDKVTKPDEKPAEQETAPEQSDNPGKIMKLDQAKTISEEEFEQQKLKKE